MDKENGKGSEGNSGSSKLSNAPDPAALLDAAGLFGAYWPRSDANAANLFAAAAAGGYGLGPHAGLPFAMLPPAGGRGVSAFPPVSSSSSSAAAAYNNAYTNTLSVAASQAASLGIPAASAAWWSMASQLATQDYLARLQASGLNFPGLGSPADPYAALGLPSLGGGGAGGGGGGGGGAAVHGNKSSKSKSLPKNAKEKNAHANNAKHEGGGGGKNSKGGKYSTASGLTIQPAKMSNHVGNSTGHQRTRSKGEGRAAKNNASSNHALNSLASLPPPSMPPASSASSSIFTSPLSLVSNADMMDAERNHLHHLHSASHHLHQQHHATSTSTTQSLSATSPSLPPSILSDPNSILGGVRLPPDTEIIKYTLSLCGPKIPGTTNRGRKKTISLDPPRVSVHPATTHSSTGMLIEPRSSSGSGSTKRSRLDSTGSDHNSSTPNSGVNDRVEVIKLPATNGSPTISSAAVGRYNVCGAKIDVVGNDRNEQMVHYASDGDAPLNLSLKPSAVNHNSTSSSLHSLSNMSASIGLDRISRRKPGPKPRKVLQPSLPPGAPSASLVQLFASADTPRPSSRSEMDYLNHAATSGSTPSSSPSMTTAGGTTISALPAPPANHKDARPRNLGRGVSKPKKNTVASLLAQSRALGIKPMPILDPNASMSQQMSFLKSNILAAQQYIAEVGGDEKTLNKFLQEKFRGTLSDSSTVDASTDSDNLTDSNQTDSELEAEMAAAKKQKQYDERMLRVPLEKGWKRETIIRGITKNGGIKGDVTYAAPDSSNKFKQMSDVSQYLEYQKSNELTKENFTFSCRVILGDYLQAMPPEFGGDGEFIRMSEDDVSKRLEELKVAMRTSLPVEQRIEVARRQQAARAAARMDREQARLQRELERSERQEAARRDKEARTQQLLEAKRKRQEEQEKLKQEEQQRKQQEREMKRQQAALLKEQMYIQEISKQRELLYTVELERERRRQHMALIKNLESRRKLEERERRKQQALAEKQANKEKKMEQRRVELEILGELRKPCEDLELDQVALPDYPRIEGLKLSGKAFGDTLMVFEFLHNFGETLGFDMESLPTLDNLQAALLNTDASGEAEEELLSVMTHLIVCAIEDPGIPNPARHTTILGQSLRQADITHTNLSEILRIYLYANATGEVKALCGVTFERDREKRVADHHQNNCEMQQTVVGKNAHYYEQLHDNPTWKMSDMLKDKPFLALNPTDKAAILAFICNELLQNKAVLRQIETSLETVGQARKDKWLIDAKVRKLRMLHSRKLRAEAIEKAVLVKPEGIVNAEGTTTSVTTAADTECAPPTDLPPITITKDEIMEDEENEMSENESLCTQPEEEEDGKLSAEELSKKLDKTLKNCESQLQLINSTSHQLRATCFGQDRFWRRYWTLPKAGGIFVEAVESAEPEILEEIMEDDKKEAELGIKTVNELERVMKEVDTTNDLEADNEVSAIVEKQEKLDEMLSKRVEIEIKETDNNANERPKTPPKKMENGEILDKREHDLDELRKNVDKMVQNIEKSEQEEEEASKENKENEKENKLEMDNCILPAIKQERTDGCVDGKKFNLFEKLGECMERENAKDGETIVKLEESTAPIVKEEQVKQELLGDLKMEVATPEIKTETSDEEKPLEVEHKWFSILNKEGLSCEGIHMTSGNRWDTGVGACTRDNITELKIPIFPPPNSNSSYCINSCDSPAPLQITPEEAAQLEYVKKYGMPKPLERKVVAQNMRYGWWRILEAEQLHTALDHMHTRGAREKELKRTILSLMQMMYEQPGKLIIEEGNLDATELTRDEAFESHLSETGAPFPDLPGSWSHIMAQRVDVFLLEQVEALEDKVANASMQQKGWRVPTRDSSDVEEGQVVPMAKERLASLESAIERRYLKPPLGVNTGDPNLAAIAQEASGTPVPQQPIPAPDEIPKGLAVWRDAVNRSQTSAQLAMCLYTLEASIAWDKSIMKANCQFCNSGDNEDKLLLCDSCDKGYHTYCFKPKLDTIPDGDWYCHECMNKATGEKNCIVCGKKQAATNTRLITCEICPRAYHTDCHNPPMNKAPRGKWYCSNCISKKPQKKAVKKPKPPSTPTSANNTCATTPTNTPTATSTSTPSTPGAHRECDQSAIGEHPPLSPAVSHGSATTNEESCAQLSALNHSLVANQSGGDATTAAAAANIANAACSPPTVVAAATSTPIVAPVAMLPSPPPPPPPPPQVVEPPTTPTSHGSNNLRKDKVTKRLAKELAPCKAVLDDLECHDDAWPFLLPVNTKQFPTYKKIIKSPMDLSTIKRRLIDLAYKSRDEFCADVRQIFNNCETFNEDDSPVGKAGHCMRQFFEARWNELCLSHS